MKLKETFINLVGFFKSSIDGKIFLSAGEMKEHRNSENEFVADSFIIHFWDSQNHKIVESREIVFNQVGDRVVLIYNVGEKYDVREILDGLITVEKEGTKYTIKRIELPL